MIHIEQQAPPKTTDWYQLNTEWEASPLSQKDFCLEKNLSYASFVSKRGKIIKKRKCVLKSHFSRVTVAHSKAIEAPSALRLTLPSGACLDIPLSIDMTGLKPILVLLGVIC